MSYDRPDVNEHYLLKNGNYLLPKNGNYLCHGRASANPRHDGSET